MACRRRSASDTFEENGIHILQKSLKKHGHHVKIIDWANQTGYASLSPIILRKINRYYTKKILNSIKNKKEPSKHIALISFFVQSS